MVLAVCATGGAADESREAASHTRELQEVNRRLQALREEVAEAEAARDDETRVLRTMEKEIGAVTLKIRELERSRQDHSRRVAELEAIREKQEGQLRSQQRFLAEQVRAGYLMGRQPRLKLLLNQDDPGRLGRILAYYDYLNRRRKQRIEETRASLQALSQTEAALHQENARIESLLAEQRTARLRLEKTRTRRAEWLAGLDADIARRSGEVTRLEADARRLEDLLDRLKKMQEELAAAQLEMATGAADTGPFKKRRGKLSWPASGTLSASFGSPKGAGISWDGVVISAAEGDPIRAIHAGRVVFSDWLKGYGLLLIIDHGDGFMSLYGYNQSLFKETGEWVSADDVVASVGDSGGREHAGLYFGIRHNGRAINPAGWCSRPGGRRVGALSRSLSDLGDRSEGKPF
ncbi:MAG: peptidoglycan DD-metalloendopeptidase family protein [Pseudomonadota bacterium]